LYAGCVLDRNQIVTLSVPENSERKAEMSPVKTALLSLAMLSSIALWGVGIYAADAASGHNVDDGYGVTAATR
jgi:hypothetical protein